MGSSRRLNKYAFVSPIAIVSSCFPSATRPGGDWFKVHAFGSEKSSSNRIFPISGRISAVGVMTGVGKVVEVEVGGHQTIAGEQVAGGVMGEIWVSVASNVGVGGALEAQQIIT